MKPRDIELEVESITTEVSIYMYMSMQSYTEYDVRIIMPKVDRSVLTVHQSYNEISGGGYPERKKKRMTVCLTDVVRKAIFPQKTEDKIRSATSRTTKTTN